ncbi:MAG: aspartate/glutamate racemase family protein [Sulfolobales archaeon]|nr:aspartate/glutamate racemase family protein [Sulfolobales archaeon]
MVSCAADPAVTEARQELKIPVIGAGSAAASLALSLGKRICVLNLTEETPEVIKRILGNHLVAEAKPRNVKSTLDLLTNWGREAAKEALTMLLRKGIDVTVLGCTGYSTIGFAKVAEEISGIRVVDPVVAAGAVAFTVIRRREAFQR